MGSVIQATGRTDFEDGLRTETKLEVRNGLQSVRTIPDEVNMVSPLGLAMTLGAVWGHNSCVRVKADQRPTCQVPRNQWYSIRAVILVLGLNWPTLEYLIAEQA